MACSLIGAYILPCRDNFGGIQEVKVRVLPSSLSDYTITSGVVTIAAGSRSGWATYGLEKNTAMFNDNGAVAKENSTVVYNQELKIIFNKLTAQVRNEIVLALIQNRLQAAVKDKNGEYWLLGYEFGLDVESANATSGTAPADRNGYELTLKGEERQGQISMSAATYNSLYFA